MNRGRRDGYGGSQDYDLGGPRYQRQDQFDHPRFSRSDSRERYFYKDYKGKWGASGHSRSRSSSPITYRDSSRKNESSMAGLIFMCNKKTQRRCLDYHVLGMPMAKKRLAEQVTPGMVLFLFEFESRDLYGVYEATSLMGIDLEPKAFVDADIDFPLQVRFRVVRKCQPLRESEYKSAILENYFETNRFKFDLNKDQVYKLLRLFVPVESSDRNLHYGYLTQPSSHDTGNYSAVPDWREPPRSYRTEDCRRDPHWRREQEQGTEDYRKDEHWRKEREHGIEDYRRDDHWRGLEHALKGPYVESHHSLDYPVHREPASYIPDYKPARYYDTMSTVAKVGSHRYNSNLWPSRPESYDYNNVLEPLPSTSTSLHQPGTSAAPYPSVSSKYEPPLASKYEPVVASKYEPAVAGYTVTRTDLVTLPVETARYWKADESIVPLPSSEPHYLKSSLYANRPGLPPYNDVGTAERTLTTMDPIEDAGYRVASKKPLLPEVEYVPAPAPTISSLATVPLTQVQSGSKEVEYRAYDANPRKLVYGYTDDSIGPGAKQSRYPISEGLPPDSSYSGGINVPETNSKDRYRRELSPRAGPPEPRYAPASRHFPHHTQREEREEATEPSKLEIVRHFDIQPPSKSYPRHSSEQYRQHSPDRSLKPTVWDRVGMAPPSKGFPRLVNSYGYNKRRRDFNTDLRDDVCGYITTECDAEESSFIDFKRRNKSHANEDAEVSNQAEGAQPRRKKIVRPVIYT